MSQCLSLQRFSRRPFIRSLYPDAVDRYSDCRPSVGIRGHYGGASLRSDHNGLICTESSLWSLSTNYTLEG